MYLRSARTESRVEGTAIGSSFSFGGLEEPFWALAGGAAPFDSPGVAFAGVGPSVRFGSVVFGVAFGLGVFGLGVGFALGAGDGLGFLTVGLAFGAADGLALGTVEGVGF